ncbi:glycine cleavage system protein GcvH [Photobacterium phosphoreum]|uniref:glycine cleavage system protein GcvH n=1 Tax=Photobacterium phosphoreum TaxID=659 RepID=UPI0007F947E6|nr:glycine cleavage system protein GcvH [Photobacterium phosphoreum]MCD9512744.1 glycine cleavage system protein GcvH [Photobacterium phosphoreum]OBU44618.1 glycine cleavage system protein H [Photobacterium phosphoreum]PSU61019.1 glycine cleavage system protein GcvH [Photobacterium phosphoreum]PSU61929.1 glycine cleavage system protein GcvH [Photobacterium phosphoreum]PSU81836.1 glycine cleavage system protein GcvH [Photobacterium phosphoreum]
MSYVPSELKFTHTHEWLRDEGDGIYTVGISDHAQTLLGDMVFIDLPDSGVAVDAGEECAVIESVKAASDIYAPCTGTILTINDELDAAPERVNSDPYGDGWLFQIRIDADEELDGLIDADDYLASIADDE